jgi:nicotinate-nucleotide--dimethylbenzimidazole phosphoribosyltransferase
MIDERLARLAKPPGSLGRLEELVKQLGAPPGLPRKIIYVLAADHGVAAEGVSAYPQSVTAHMVRTFLRGGAAINVLARCARAKVVVADFGVIEPTPAIDCRIGPGTRNLAKEPAMTPAEARRAIELGRKLVQDCDLIGVGEMGIGNSTSAAAITSAITHADAALVTGRGTGINNLSRKIEIVRNAVARGGDPLVNLGGFEIAGMVGVILEAARRRIPVLIDGFISTAAALVARQIEPGVPLIASHRSAEPGHKIALEHLGLRPILDLDLRLGEGTGAALAMPILDAACAIYHEMEELP